MGSELVNAPLDDCFWQGREIYLGPVGWNLGAIRVESEEEVGGECALGASDVPRLIAALRTEC
jgi:hypothetical protein